MLVGSLYLSSGSFYACEADSELSFLALCSISAAFSVLSLHPGARYELVACCRVSAHLHLVGRLRAAALVKSPGVPSP